MKRIYLALIFVFGIFLVACGSAKPAMPSNPGIANAKAQNTPTPSGASSNDLVRTDDQGAVSFSVQPLNLNSPGDTLDFEVSMNTHSVN